VWLSVSRPQSSSSSTSGEKPREPLTKFFSAHSCLVCAQVSGRYEYAPKPANMKKFFYTILLSFFLLSSSSFADFTDVPAQNDNINSTNVGGSNWSLEYDQDLGDGWTGTFSDVWISCSLLPSDTVLAFVVFPYLGSGSPLSNETLNLESDCSTGYMHFSADTPYTLNATYAYQIAIRAYQTGTNGENMLFGVSTTGTEPFPDLRFAGGSGITDTVMTMLFAEPMGEDGVYPSSPLSGSVNTPVLFEGVYTNAGTFDKMVFSVSDLTDSNSQGYEFSLPLMSGIGLEYAFTIPLTANHDYEYQVWLKDSSDNSISAVTDFYAIDTYPGTTGIPPIEQETCDEGTIGNAFSIGCHVRNALIWAFVPSSESLNQFTTLTLRDKKPFAYIYDVNTLYQELFDADATENLDVSVDVPSFGSEITLLQQSDLEAVPFASTIKLIFSAMIYFFTAMTIYRTILRRTHA